MPYPNFKKSLFLVASHADVLRGSSRVPAPRGAGTRLFPGEAKREAIDIKSCKKNSFSVNIGFVIRIVLKIRVFGTWKLPIVFRVSSR